MPQVKKNWGILGTFVLIAVLFVAGLHFILGDYLLFHSDPVSLGIYLSAAMLVVLPGLLVLSLPLLLLPRPSQNNLRLYLALGLAVLVATVFIMLAISFIGAWFDIAFIKGIARQPFLLFAVCAVPALGAIVARRSAREIASQTEQLGLALLAVAIIGLSLVQLIESERGTGPKKNLVLMILDGMPTQYLHGYEPAAPVGPLDRLAAEGLVMTEARTAAAWTSAYFGTLYGGSTQVVEAPRDQILAVDSLFARLQRGGISARWISNHRNGMPEGSAVHTNDYRGLRSYLLTESTAWIPRLLNLDYHLAIASEAVSQNLRGKPARALFEWINGENRQFGNYLTEQLLPLLREQQTNAGSTFTLFHTSWNETGGAANEEREKLPKAQEIAGLKDVAPNAIDVIRANDYLYDPEVEPLAVQYRRGAWYLMVDLGAHLTGFMAALTADETLRDTIVIVTADHGTMYKKGRFWYGYHPNEEVVRVPLLIFNAGRKGQDDRLVNTLDINASVLGFFEISRDSDSGQSIFEANAGRVSVQTLTLRSDRNKEWFLLIGNANRKYRINLHPEGRGETVTLRLDGYEETPIAETIGPPDGMAELIAEAVRNYGIDPNDIHPALRVALVK